jgi:predicted kinase
MTDGVEARRARLILVCGLPGAGKTVLARRLEAKFGGVRFCADDWMADLEIDLVDEVARERIERLQWRLAQRILDFGGVAIIEWGTWARAERDALREGARLLGASVELRFLDAPVDALWTRVRERDAERAAGHRALTRDDIAAYAAVFEPPDAEELSLYDPPLQ